jgi:hypothetical protein
MGFAKNGFSGASELSALAVSKIAHTPGLALIKSVQVMTQNLTASSLTSIIVDAPFDADFRNYRAILFRFSGVGFSSAANDLIVTPRREGATVPGSYFSQINQITSATATGWVTTNSSATAQVTGGSLVAANMWLNRFDILMTPTGFDCDIRVGNGTTLATGAIVNTTVSYSASTSQISNADATSYPGVSITTTAGAAITAAQYGGTRLGIGLNCEIYGYTIS